MKEIESMGYKSQVCIGLTDDATRLFRTMLEHLPDSHEAHNLIKDAATSQHHRPWTDQHKSSDVDCEDKMYWDHVKWYERYECVDFIENFLSECIPEEDYRFVRVGEDTNDVEERGEHWDSEIFVERSISW